MNIKVDLSSLISSNRSYAIIYIDSKILKTVSDVIEFICKIFGIIDHGKCSIYEGIWYIPRNQSSHIFENIQGVLRLCDDNEESSLTGSDGNVCEERNAELCTENIGNSSLNINLNSLSVDPPVLEPKKVNGCKEEEYKCNFKGSSHHMKRKFDECSKNCEETPTINYGKDNLVLETTVYNGKCEYDKELESNDEKEPKRSRSCSISLVEERTFNIMDRPSGQPKEKLEKGNKEVASSSNKTSNFTACSEQSSTKNCYSNDEKQLPKQSNKSSFVNVNIPEIENERPLQVVSLDYDITSLNSPSKVLVVKLHEPNVSESMVSALDSATCKLESPQSALDPCSRTGEDSYQIMTSSSNKEWGKVSNGSSDERDEINRSSVSEHIDDLVLEEKTAVVRDEMNKSSFLEHINDTVLEEKATVASSDEDNNQNSSKTCNFDNEGICDVSSVSSACDSSILKKKRRRKHNKKKKREQENKLSILNSSQLLKENKFQNSLFSRHQFCTNKKETFLHPNGVHEGHIIFQDSDDDNDDSNQTNSKSNYLNTCKDQDLSSSCDNLVSRNTSDLNATSLFDLVSQTSPKVVQGVNCEKKANNLSDSCSETSVITPKINNHRVFLHPPSGVQDYEQISTENKLKFSKLASMEFSYKPKTFRSTRKLHSGYNEPKLENELPLSFASKKDKVRCSYASDSFSMEFAQYKRIKKNRSCIMNSTGIDSPTTYNEHDLELRNKESLTPDLNCSDETMNNCEQAVTPTFTGAKPSKRDKSKRYFLSIGNVLKSLKKSGSSTNLDSNSFFNNQSKERPGEEKEIFLPSTLSKNEENGNAHADSLSTTSLQCSPSRNSFQTPKQTQDILEEQQMLTESASEIPNSKTECDEVKDIVDIAASPEHNGCSDIDREKKFISFELYPLLQKLPQSKDVIAVKVMTLDENMCPCYSDYKVAEVVSVIGLQIELKFLDDTKNLKSKDKKTVNIDWRDMKDTRIIYP